MTARTPDQEPPAPLPPLAGGADGPQALAPLVATVLDALGAGAARRGGPLPAGGPDAVAAGLAGLLTSGALLPDHGDPDALRLLTEALAATAADPADPACAAHLHAPPLAVAVAADLAVAAVNPSLDSWDQAPGATSVELAVLRTLVELVGFPASGTGVFTTGGSESNLTALLLARDAVSREQQRGGRFSVHCSADAHFSVGRAAAVLGLGPDAVVPVDTAPDGRMDPRVLDWGLADARAEGRPPLAVVATAGTTDRGAVDPLRAVAAVARRHGTRLHVDAAYGAGALFSRRLAPLLDGLELADTIGLDLHKLGWQPVAAGALLVRDPALLAPLGQRAAYLNPADDEEAGYTSLLGRSLRTTRRPDAFKVAVTLRALGRAGLGALVDRCHDLARHAAAGIAAEPRLELTAEPVLTSVLFRYLPQTPDAPADAVNAGLRRRLLAAGQAVVGRTELADGSVRLKLTLLNPHTTEADVDRLLALVLAAGAQEEHS
ncbi:aspartate aminotransferase family protein [Streptacidiphilus sp. PB12-B1b]|uniref:pyridoxal phosphate-dependent decarboxylase family protein n=1 Tax=Streptacidiphilus sp. PB12-B1b TaxID=2705012 RepID=UPI0015FE3EA9|nr:pyridoxal-dependent decarboxylase [Streptacidiphilus sp. PB12-B1b]QMU78740.1 aspartate aminotransferase family protein [Streptacidiphilus sp. PB12-B1b]